MKNHFLQKISLLVALLSTSLFSVNAATIWSSTGTDFTINRGTTVTFNALFGISEDWSGYTNLQITFEAGTQSGNSAGQATILKDGVNIFTADKMGSSNQFKAYTVTIGDAVDLAWGTSTNYNARLRNITITGDPGCANATTSFTDGNLVTKYASDVPFTNTFNSNNQSAQTWASSNPGVADVNQNGEVTLTGTVGTTVISVTQPVDATNAICAANASYTLEVTAAPELIFTPDPLPTLVYIEGQGPSAIATIYITGTNLPAGDVNIGPGNVWASLSPSGPFAYAGLTIENFAGGTLAPTPIYIQHPGTLPAGTYPDVAFIGAGIGASVNTERFFIPVVVSAPPTNPTLLVNPTQITGLDYVFGLGASAAQSFNVSGSLLDGTDITISAPVDFEVSLAQASGFATSVTIPGVSGTLASTPVYVRLAAGKAIGNYTLDIAVSGGGDVNSYVVAVSGAVTPAPLPAPTLGTPDTPTEEGFTAYWNAVAGAQGYIINVYQNGVLTTTVNATAAETSKVITGLNPSTTYTYKVIAVGDGVNNTNSPESVASAPITTNVASVVITSPCGDTMISRYQSDLSEWAAMAADGSNNDIVLLTGSGGFTSTHRPQVNQNEIPSNYWETGSNGGTLTFPDFEFINGGYVVIELTVNGNNRNINLTANGSANGITASSVGGGTAAGNNVALSSGTYTITYTLDASINGITSLALKPSNSNMYVTGITVCSNPGTNPVLTYTADPANPQPFTAVIGGNTDMKAIQVKGFNLQDIVNLEITGEKAGYFSVNLENINIASAEAGKNIWITYKSSAIPSVQEAVLRITSLNANVIEVPLKGISTPADVTKPVILADNSTIPFWTSLITNQTKTLSIAGINLIGDVTLRITGAGAGEFTVNKSTILQADALKGSSVDITYIADTKASTANAVLEISSRGADTVYVPLTGYTFLEKPELFELKFEVSPSGSASITADPAGTMYLKGTEVTAKVTPEPDWIIDYWSDAGGNRSAERKIIVSDLKNGTITVFMREDPGIVIIDPTSTFVAYPPENVSQTGFKGIWSSAENATNYVVNVYDKNKDLIHTALPAGMANELVVTGLTAGEYYYYEVVADVPATPDNNMTGKETTGMVGPFPTLPAPSTFVCGN